MNPLPALAAFFLTATLANAQTTQPTKPLVVGYAPNWIDTAAFAATFPFEKITHLNIAFENPLDESGTLSWSPRNDALIQAAHKSNIKVLLSIGGGAASGDKKLLALNAKLLDEPLRNDFAKKLAQLCIDKNLDGLDIDIEGPAIIPAYPGFIAALHRELKPKGKEGKLLTAALSVGYGGNKVPPETLALFDLIHIMAYDGTGHWDPNRPGQHSSFDMAKSNVSFFTGRGVPLSKLTLGLPFYGYGFGNAFKKRDYPYKQIITDFPTAHQSDTIGDTIYYNGIKTIQTKTAWALGQGLAGVMIWSLDLDAPKDSEKSLLSAIHAVASTRPSQSK